MRLVLDLQACQTSGSRFRGIGRYSAALATAMLREAKNHECYIVLNGAFPDSIEAIREDFHGLLPDDHIRVWNTSGSVSAGDGANHWRRRVDEVMREAYIQSLKPDIVHVSSLFEGLGDNAVTSIHGGGLSPLTAVTLFDLIPLIHRDVYLNNQIVNRWYFEKLESLRKAHLLLAISESSRQEAIKYLEVSADRVVNISSAADSMFRPLSIAPDVIAGLREKFGLTRPFVMYTGGIDHRKNIEGLIRAFAMLPPAMRESHQLAIVCNAVEEDRLRLQRLAASCGMKSNDLVMTGFVSDEELVALSNLCKLFVFPSWHEGFGLPALEAMSCGAPVIAAKSSSLPEVVGRADALFDPMDDSAISAAINHALASEAFREDLSRHGIARAKLFSWEETGRRALRAMEDVVDKKREWVRSGGLAKKLRLAYVSPVPPQKSGVANYSAKLLPVLAGHYDIEVISDEVFFSGSPLSVAFPRRSVSWFLANASEYDRVVYQFGNSAFHDHMFEMLRRIPGAVVLHDFYLGHLQRHREFLNRASNAWWQALYESHGYAALIERQAGVDSDLLVSKYPCNFRVLADADGVIVHSAYCLDLVKRWYGDGLAGRIRHVPHLHEVASPSSKEFARQRVKLPADAFVVASFGFINPSKLIHRILSAWNLSGLHGNADCVLVLAGECADVSYAEKLDELIAGLATQGHARVIRTGYLEPEQYQDLLVAADVAIQLRSDSRGETSGAVLDCLAHGVPTIVNAHGANAELPGGILVKLEDDFSDDQLAAEILRLRFDSSLRKRLTDSARAYVKHELAPHHVASLYRDAIEAFAQHSPRRHLHELAAYVAEATAEMDATDDQLIDASRRMVELCPLPRYRGQWLVDVSELANTDAKSGIQRVVRSVLSHLLSRSPEGARIEPIYCDEQGVYRYARQFTSKFLNLPIQPDADAAVEVSSGDVFLGLDLCPHIIPGKIDYFRHLRSRGVQIVFVLYDLLPAQQPSWFPPKIAAFLREWYVAIGQISDRVIAISKSVANEYREWLDQHAPHRLMPLMISSFHLGADIVSSQPTMGVPKATRKAIEMLADRPVVLVVGTVEPRKGHAQVLDAFEELWQRGSEAVLVLIGKRGWGVEALVKRLAAHPQSKRKLFWFEGVSDEALELIYGRASILLAASWGEGFGLPLIEAARLGVPVLVRDLPVFREVAGIGAIYFTANTASELADAVESALARWRSGELPNPDQILTLTWEESANQLLAAIKGERDHWAWGAPVTTEALGKQGLVSTE